MQRYSILLATIWALFKEEIIAYPAALCIVYILSFVCHPVCDPKIEDLENLLLITKLQSINV